MFWFADFMLIIPATYILYKVIKTIITKGNTSLNYFSIIVVYVFCVIPIILNYCIGLPKYSTLYWYKPFIKPMRNQIVTIIYDVYILTSIVIMYFAGKRYLRKYEMDPKYSDVMPEVRSLGLWITIYLLPYIYILVTGKLVEFTYYGSLSQRGIIGTSNTIINSLILISIYSITRICFSGMFNKKKFIFLLIGSFLLAWIQGKRFILAEMILIYLYCFSRTEKRENVRKKLWVIIPIIGCALIAFSVVYLAIIKPLSDMSSESIYDMLRVDFGRDDVIKYTIYKLFMLKENILDYPGQSFLSLIFIFIPRSIWPSKPFQHYMYLTSSILGV